MKFFILCLFVLFITNSFSETKPEDLILLVNGEKQKSLNLEALKKLKIVTLDFYDHASRKSDRFTGVPFKFLMNANLPEEFSRTVEVELISTNGFKNYFSMENFLKVDAIISYEAVNGKFERFSIKEKKIVQLGPYYLVWDFKSMGLEDKYQYNSVYQINKINLITNAVDFETSHVKNNESIHLGFRTYKRYCLSCHAIGAWGGELGIDLIKNKILAKKGADFIKKYALDPHSLNAETKMLALPKYKNREKMAQGLVEFLDFASHPNLIKKDQDDSLKIIINEMK